MTCDSTALSTDPSLYPVPTNLLFLDSIGRLRSGSLPSRSAFLINCSTRPKGFLSGFSTSSPDLSPPVNKLVFSSSSSWVFISENDLICGPGSRLGSGSEQQTPKPANLVLFSEDFGSLHHVGQRSSGLFPSSGLQTTVWVNPELVGWVYLHDFTNSGHKLLLGWNSWRVDVEQSKTNVVWIVGELLDVLRIVLLRELNGDNVGVQGFDVVRVKVGVAEVRVDLSVVSDTRGRDSERLSSPLQVVGSLLTGSQWQSLSDGWLVDLNDGNTSGFEVVDLVSQSKRQLQRLHLLGNIVSWERPSQTGDWTGQHTLHWFFGQRLGIDTFFNGHGLWSRHVSNNDRWSDVSRTIGLHPTVGGESVTLQLLTKVLNHIVSLWLTMDENIQSDLLLESDDLLNLRVDELLVLLSSDLTLDKLVSINSNVLGLWERTDGCGWEQRQVVLGFLLGKSLWEWRLSGGQGLVDLGQSGLNGLVVGQVRFLSALDSSSISLQSGRNVFTRNSLGDGDNLGQFLGSEREPVLNLGIKLLLVLQIHWSVQQRGGGRDDNVVGSQLLDGLLDELNGLSIVVLPDVSSVNDTNGQSLFVGNESKCIVQLLWASDKIEMETGNRQALDSRQVWSDITEIGGQDELWKTFSLGQGLVGGLECGLDLFWQVQNEGWLVDLDLLGACFSKLLQDLGVDWQDLLEQRDWLQVKRVLVWLTQVQVGNRTNKNRSGLNAKSLGLQVLVNWLLTIQLELCGVGECWSDIVVVGVKPLDHLQSCHVDCLGSLGSLSLQTSTHGEQDVQLRKIELGVSFWDHIKQNGQIQNLVVEREVVGRNDVDTSFLLQLPVLFSDLLTNSKKLISTDLACPVGLSVLLELSESSDSWESQNARLNHFLLI
ncbi:hypothetical protein OGATHE_004153 [Ogataea polymorpha]|uniref:Uncharacterized protein n=1 Tax=Ogataea polymorpha TaxID=460523 RepID=A0A9P8P5H4_9ASCO|nr:hypothetical protein OGATHE_004153 [Ogataea polymorpha]